MSTHRKTQPQPQQHVEKVLHSESCDEISVPTLRKKREKERSFTRPSTGKCFFLLFWYLQRDGIEVAAATNSNSNVVKLVIPRVCVRFAAANESM